MKAARKAIFHRCNEIGRFTTEIQRLVKKNPEVSKVQNRIEFLLNAIFNTIKAVQAEVPKIETFLVHPDGTEIAELNEVTAPVPPLKEPA